MRLYALHCGGDLMDWAAFDPFDERVGTKVYNPYFMYVVTHPRGNVLFDTGVHPQMGTDPEARLGPAAASFEARVTPEDHIEARLGRIGLRPSDIDIVVQSHLHFDHAGGLEWLTHAPILIQREELSFAMYPPVYQRSIYVAADFRHDLDWHPLEGDHDVFGDGRLLTLSTPGHSRGHQSLIVHLDSGQTVILLADAAYTLAKMRERAIPGVVWSPDAIVSSWERIEALERAHDALLIATHDLDFRERVKLAPEVWYK
ncbi:MAG: N-acyl homoserine lactonase family protein [Actinomycetota bacterium]|nr:N-acyl homoserine lactonase family protein [Actinomycetota bacterium]